MKRLMIGLVALAAISTEAAIAKVQQIEHKVRPVYNSGTGVMPAGAQESMPKAAKQIARDSIVGVGYSPVQLAIVNPIQFPPADYDVGGLRIDIIYGQTCNFDGLDIGIVGVATGHANGLQVSAVNCGLNDGMGLAVAGANFFGGDYLGMQVAFGNWIESGKGLQIGGFNRAYDFTGLQIGFVNIAEHLDGMQIGVANIIGCSDLKFFPVINYYF